MDFLIAFKMGCRPKIRTLTCRILMTPLTPLKTCDLANDQVSGKCTAGSRLHSLNDLNTEQI